MSQYVPDGEAVGEGVEPVPETSVTGGPTDGKNTDLEALVVERTADLQRLQAEYVNYKKRVDRDRAVARRSGIEAVMIELLPVLDAISAAESHNELNGGFKLVADELTKVTLKHGLKPFGEVGDPFNPHKHEALMHMPMPGVTTTTCSAIIQPGYELHDRVLRPARVGVAEPQAAATPDLSGVQDAPTGPDLSAPGAAPAD